MAQASEEKLEHTGQGEKKIVASVPQREQLASLPGPPLPKGKGTKPRQYRAPDREGERVKVSESRTLARERGRSEREHGEDRMDSTVKKGGFQGGELL